MANSSFASGIALAGLFSVLVATACSSAKPGQPTTTSTTRPAIPQPTSKPTGLRVVDFQPGIRIDFRVPQVEIEGKVILREGPLELFAYSKAPVPKEHESIVLMQAKPQAIYNALGLIGLTPGKPPRYFPETKVNRAASGDRVNVRVRYMRDGRSIERPATEWMMDMKAKKPMADTPWVFAGSEKDERGQFAADIEGTAVTVVDFPSSLLSLPASHTSDDSELWLTANTAEIPEKGTPVTLILRPNK